MTQTIQRRFRDGRTFLSSFNERIDVQCPQCGADACVTEKSLTCAWCGSSVERGPWFGPAKGTVNRACGHCGRRLSREILEHPPKRETFRLQCPGCHHRTRAAISWQAIGNAGYDPFFGAKLKLRRRCGRELFWAYNRAHLQFVEDYVSADLRERTAYINASLTSRMPAWIKSAKNRQQVLKAIAGLRSKSQL